MNDEMFKRLSDMLDNSVNTGTSSNFDRTNIGDTFNNMMSGFASNNDSNNNNNNGFDFSNIDMETISKIQNIIGKMNANQHSPRSNLLSSLKPYLKPSRQEKLDQYLQFANIASILESFNNSGGDN